MRTRVSRVLPIGGIALATVIGGAAQGAAQTPPGNNGTVKIDDVVFDDHPDNEPHDGCVFQVDFYGYDEGDLSADVTFEAIDPTGAVDPLLTDTLDIGEDDNSGGGSEAGLDASGTYDLTDALAGITPHPQQGWHVKLTVHADGSQGADTKYKAFWVSGCGVTATTSTTTSTPTSSTTVPTSTTVGEPGSTTTSTVGITPQASTTVLPGSGVPGGPSGSSPGGSTEVEPVSSGGGLPVTGSESLVLAALAALMVGAGVAVRIAAQRLRSTDSP